ncbi:hypothetical protein PDIDSM_2068 [Penicillium digitatum]|nr:hypothetical protein PDIDSM_2068 [Penicillium digitatum]
MSQSQQSEFASSQFGGDYDNLSYLIPSNYPATPSTSQQTFDASVPAFLRPDDPPLLPHFERFERVGPDRKRLYFLYDRMNHQEWVEWWLQPDYGSKCKVAWHSNHLSHVWDHFTQVAHSNDGSPKVMRKHCSAILETPYAAKKDANRKDARHGTTTMTRHLRTSACKRADNTIREPFSEAAWEDNLLQFITINRLPFHLIEHPTFRRIISQAHSAPSLPSIPSADTVRRRISARVEERQHSTLKLLPADAKISIALDCWTLPFGQAFMAITGYFIDIDWSYREILADHNIQDRVFGITTDNASNNKTLVDSLLQALSSDIHVIRIPCLAHVIQLSLNQLLDRLKAVPQNDTTETKWSDRQSILAKANAQSENHSISHTLNKSQRREAFVSLQPSEQALMPLQDVKTRWNSTFLMLRRAKRLRDFLGTFCTDYNCEEMALNNDEWRQIDYLLCLTKPFYEDTLALSKTRDVTAHLVFQIYNMLFEHLEKSIKQLQRKHVPWKQQMLSSLEAGRLKLDEFQFFLTDDWTKEWRDKYRASFQDTLLPYQERQATSQGLTVSSPGSRPSTALHNLLRPKKPKAKPVGDEITQYLDGDVVDSEPLPFWRENHSRFPAIASLARDILTIPATGAGGTIV